MKKILFISALLTSAFLSSCDHEHDYPGLEEAALPTLVKNYTITYDGKYPAGGAFTSDNPVGTTIQDWLFTKYYACDKGSAAQVTYKYSPYKAILNQTFERKVTANAVTTIDGWQNIATQGAVQWQDKTFGTPVNTYTQFTAFKAPGACEGWFISPSFTPIDGSVLSFDVCVGNYNASCLKVLISLDYDGVTPTAATWVDVTSSFAIPVTPTSGYGTIAPAGSLSLKSYVGKKIYVAFKYVGNGTPVAPATLATTTYQIDNVFAGIPGVAADKTEQYVFTGQKDKWVFDPTVNLVIDSKDNVDFLSVVNWVKTNKPTFADPAKAQEFYFGISSYYGNISFDYVTRQSTYGDTELAAAADEAAKIKIMWDRMPQAFDILLKAKYPQATNMVAGIVVDYNVTFKVYEKYASGTSTSTYTGKFNFNGTKFVQIGTFVKK